MEKNRLRPNLFAGATLALSAGFLVACAEPLTPETAGRMDGRKFAAENGFCPPQWRDEHGIVPARLAEAFYAGLYDSPETLDVLNRYRTYFDIACESQLISPRSDV